MNGWIIAFSSAVILGSIVVIAVPSGTKGEMRLCDKAVSTLLASTDPVELRRASISSATCAAVSAFGWTTPGRSSHE